MPLNIQSAPETPNYDAQSIQISAQNATPQASMAGIKAQAGQLNAVNSLSGGRGGRRGRGPRTQRRGQRNTFKEQKQHQKGGSSQSGGQIPIPQVGSLCNSGPQCSAVQNANLTAVSNQATSNGLNDSLKGGRGRGRGRGRDHKKVRFSRTRTHTTRTRRTRHDQSLTTLVAYNIKKVMRKIFQ